PPHPPLVLDHGRRRPRRHTGDRDGVEGEAEPPPLPGQAAAGGHVRPRQIHQHRPHREADAVPERRRMPAAPGPEPGRRSGQGPEHHNQVTHHRPPDQATPDEPAAGAAGPAGPDGADGADGAAETGTMRSARKATPQRFSPPRTASHGNATSPTGATTSPIVTDWSPDTATFSRSTRPAASAADNPTVKTVCPLRSVLTSPVSWFTSLGRGADTHTNVIADTSTGMMRTKNLPSVHPPRHRVRSS